jgi:hypothetical protein
MGKIQNRVLQDRRRLSRISVQMECRFKSEESSEYGALLLDLSPGGALISSTLLPPRERHNFQERFPDKNKSFPSRESKISITLEDGNLKVPMKLSGRIRRSSVNLSEYGKVAQFGIELENTPLELLRLISRLSTHRKAPRVSAQIDCRYRMNGGEYAAHILELSTESALFQSAVVPATGSKIFIIIKEKNMEAPLTLDGTVEPQTAFGREEEGRFEVSFESSPPKLRMLINTLSGQRS